MVDSRAGLPTIKGWKAIAAHFGRDERTVMRWADQRGLPVRRLPGGGRSSVYALAGELDAWLSNASAPREADPESREAAPVREPAADLRTARDRRGRMGGAVGVGAILVAVLLVVLAVGVLIAQRSRVAPTVAADEAIHDPIAEQSFLQGRYDLSLRSPESLHRAIDEFGAAIAADPSAAPAYAGLGETYFLLREYSDFPEGQAFARAGAAASAAVALQPNLAAAHRVLAVVAFWRHQDVPRARTEFLRALALAPDDALTHHWYATALSANGEFGAAIAQIREARRLDPQSTALIADYGLLTVLAGHRAEGFAMLDRVARDQPDTISAHVYLSGLALVDGDGTTYLREAGAVARLRGDAAAEADLAIETAAFDRGGFRALLDALWSHQAALVARTHRGFYRLAVVAALRHDEPKALSLLRLALERGEAGATGFQSDLPFRPFLDHPGFAEFARRRPLAP